jgi:hypothetical protein
MAKTKPIDETLLPRPPGLLDVPAIATATRRTADKLEELFNLSPEAAEAFAAVAVDPAEVRKAAENPERLYVPGGTLLGLRTRVWARRVMPDPRNPRVGPARRHPVAVAPGSDEDSRFRPVPSPEPATDGHPELTLDVVSREHLSWASGIAKGYVLKANDWRASIRNQGVMTEVWLSAVTIQHADGTAPVTVPVTSEGSSRVTACHDILDVRSADVPYNRDDRALRSIIRNLNEAFTNGPTAEQAESLRCETIPALLLVGFEPNPGSAANFAAAVRSLVALRHVDRPEPWKPEAVMESIADAVLQELADVGMITPVQEAWYAGDLTPAEAVAHGFSDDPAVRAAAIVRLVTNPDPTIQHAVRVAITGQSTRTKITTKFKLQVAGALILRSVTTASDRERLGDIQRAMRDGFADSFSSGAWRATHRPVDELVEAAVKEVEDGAADAPAGLELAARAGYALIVDRDLHSDRGTAGNKQPDRRSPGLVVERMRGSVQGLRQLGQAVTDVASGRKPRAVDATGNVLTTEDGTEQTVSDVWLRTTYHRGGSVPAPAAQDTVHEQFQGALNAFSTAMDDLVKSASKLVSIEGLDGRPLIDIEGVDPADTSVWLDDLTKISQAVKQWETFHIVRHGRGGGSHRALIESHEEDDEFANYDGVDDAVEEDGTEDMA